MKFPLAQVVASPTILLLCVALIAVAQTSKRKVRPTKPQPDVDRQAESACGVRQSARELVDEMKIEWRELGYSDSDILYYNTRKMLCDKKGILKVWVKRVEMGKSYSKSTTRYELNCRALQMRIFSILQYNASGAVVKHFTYEDARFEDLVPGSIGETVWETACRKTL